MLRGTLLASHTALQPPRNDHEYSILHSIYSEFGLDSNPAGHQWVSEWHLRGRPKKVDINVR